MFINRHKTILKEIQSKFRFASQTKQSNKAQEKKRAKEEASSKGVKPGSDDKGFKKLIAVNSFRDLKIYRM